MLTPRQIRLYNYLVENDYGAYIRSDELAAALDYKARTRRNAMSLVQSDAAKLVEEYALGELEYCVVGINTVGYKIGTQKEVSAYIGRRWKHIIRALKVVKGIAEKAGLDGQLTFTEEGIEEMVTIRREHE